MSNKGASELDKNVHRVFAFATSNSNGWHKTDIICQRCKQILETSYCEERVYMIRCQRCKMITIAEGKSPNDVAAKIGGKVNE